MIEKIKKKVNKYNKLIKKINLVKVNLILNNNILINKFIKLENILIIASNTIIINYCLEYYKNVIIYLIVYNNINISEFMILKKKYPETKIYFVGNNIDITFYKTINLICNNIKFNTIIIDNDLSINKYHNEFLIICGFLLSNNLLIENGTYIQYMICPNNNNILLLKLLNILYDSFENHKIDKSIIYDFNRYRKSFFIFSSYIKKNIIYYDIFIRILESYYNEEILNNNLDNIKYELSNKLLLSILNKWNRIILIYKKYLKNIQLKQYGGEFSYHRIKYGNEPELKKVPIYINDISKTDVYNEELLEWQPRCHWGQKKLLLSEIQFFTRISKTLNITNFKDYAVVYIGSAGGHHLPILYNMFPELIWLLYDPAPFSKDVYKHPLKDSAVYVYNMFFTDETIKHVKANSQNRKILFISDIRVEAKEITIIKDMGDQAYWGMELNSEFMLLKFRLPYDDLDKVPINNNQFRFDNKKLINPLFKTEKKDNMIYLKGDIYLQIFPPPYSGELRLFIEQKNNKYELDEYNYIDIQNKIFKYNSQYRIDFICNNKICKEIPIKYLNLIPGYDTSIECLMEYIVLKDYYNYFFNIDNNIKIINKIYDMNFYLEKLTNRKFYNCTLDTTIKYYYRFKKNNNINAYNKLEIWKDIIKVKINLNIQAQLEYIKIYGKEILGNDKFNDSINYLNKFYNSKLLYYKL